VRNAIILQVPVQTTGAVVGFMSMTHHTLYRWKSVA